MTGFSDAQAQRLYHWLTGVFENQAQAQAQPTWFVHLRLWQRVIPQGVGGCRAIFAEQANVLYLDKPYRQRVMVIHPELRQIHYWALKQPSLWSGVGQTPERLQGLQDADLEPLSGCVLDVELAEDRYTASLPATSRCCFEYQGQERQVILGFQLSADQLLSYDRGVDPQTGQGLWGAVMGPYEFQPLPSAG